MQHHIASTKMYLSVFAALMALTFLTVFVRLGLHIESVVIAFSIATVKATLVVLYFMHVKWSTSLTKAAVVTAMIFLGVLLLLISMDYVSRPWQIPGGGWEKYPVLR